jgi:hypothetical protein
MVLMKLAVNPQTAAPALKELTGLELEMPEPAPVVGDDPGAGGPVGAEDQDEKSKSSTTGPPDTQSKDADDAVTASARRDQVIRRTRSSRRRARMDLARR